MVSVYKTEDFERAEASKKAILRGFFISLALVLAVCITIFVFYVLQEYNTPLKQPLLITNIVISSVYAIVMFFIFSIKYKRVSSYVKMLIDMQMGIKSESVNTYVRTDSSIVKKDGVDFISIIVLEWSEKKQEYFERRILLDVEKHVPDFKPGDVIKHLTHANILMAYELASDTIFE
jgi:hypothetical protein